jgi:hypothetical protein
MPVRQAEAHSCSAIIRSHWSIPFRDVLAAFPGSVEVLARFLQAVRFTTVHRPDLGAAIPPNMIDRDSGEKVDIFFEKS